MPKFADFINAPYTNQKRTTDKLGPTLDVQPEGFLAMLTNNGYDRRFSNHWIVEACLEELQRHVGGGNAEISAVHLERNSIRQINTANRQVCQVSDDELLEASPDSLIASRAIVTLDVRGLNDEYRPSMAINLSPEGEEIAFGSTVDICTNFTILSADRRYSTFQRHRDRTKNFMDIHELMREVKKLFPVVEHTLETEINFIEQLKMEEISRREWEQFIGALFSWIHYVNRQRLNRKIADVPAEQKELPVTATLLANIAAEAYAPSYPEYDWEGDMTNKWKALNFGTEVIKLERGVPASTWLEAGSKWSSRVLEHKFSEN